MGYERTLLGLTGTVLVCLVGSAICQSYDTGDYDYSPESEAKDEPEDSGFVTPLDFSPLFGGASFGLNSAASADVFQKLPKKYQSVFDVGGSESQLQDVFGAQSASDKQFAPQNFGFIPTFSQGLAGDVPSQPNRYQQKTVEIERTKATAQSSAISRAPLQFNIQTKHEKGYKKQPEADLSGLSLSAYKEKPTYSPTLADYKTPRQNEAPRVKNDEHLAPYKKYSFQPVPAAVPTYQALAAAGYSGGNTYSQLPILDSKLYRSKRYSGNRRNQKQKKENKNDDYEPSYGYLSDYNVRPKEFDQSSRYSAPDFSGYDEDAEKKEYDYGSDEEYGSDEYERIKSLSEKQAAQVKKNPENCKKVQKDSMTCMVCQDPKTGGSYESCSYVSEPKNNKYAYVKEQKYDSKDDPEEPDESAKSELKQKPETSQELNAAPVKLSSKIVESKPVRGEIKFQPSVRKPQKLVQQPKYNSYYTQSQNPEPIDSSESNKYSAYKESDEKSDDYDEDDKDYESSIPGFFTNTEEKKNVEHVLAEFVKKDRSACKKVFKNHMTCYQCTDKNGLKHEECMFVSESAPKSSHLAYKEVKEFNSKPQPQNTNIDSNDEAESKVVSTSNPLPTPELLLSTTELVTFPPINLKKKQLFKKFSGQDEKLANLQVPELTDSITTKFYSPEAPTIPTKIEGPVKRNVKRSPTKQQEKKASQEKTPLDITPSADSHLDNIANPADFASEESKGAFWAETVPRYSKELGVSLPEYMLAKSEHEEFFDEFLSSGK